MRESVLAAGSLLAAVIDDVCRRVPDPDASRWVAAVLAALSHQVQVSTLPPPLSTPQRATDKSVVVLAAVPAAMSPHESLLPVYLRR
jgi:hypothetical protein